MGKPRARGNGDGTIFAVPGRRKPWAAAVTVGWTIEGRPIRRTRFASSEREARRRLVELVEARDAARPLPDDRLTAGKWLVAWLRSPAVTRLRPNTVETYTASVRAVLPEIGGVPLRKLRSPAIDAALATMPPRVAINTRSVLSTAFREAMRAGHVTVNEAALARAPRTVRRKLPAPDRATVRAVLAELETHRLYALFALLAGTGLRIGEATGLRWSDLEGDRLRVELQLQLQGGEYVLTDLKAGEAKTIAIGPHLAETLRRHRIRQSEEKLSAGRKWRKAGLMFTTPKGQPVAESTAQWVLARACQRARTRHLSPHDFRRFAASEIEDAMGREASQLLLGHTSPGMTERYVSVRDSMLERAAGVLDEAVG